MKAKTTTYVQRVLVIIALLSCQLPLMGEESEQKTKPHSQDIVSIKKVSGESGKKLSIVTIYLNEKPKTEKIAIESHGNFLQISLKNTLVPKPGKFYDISSPYFKKMVLIQSQDNEAIVRIFTSQEGSLIAKATDVDVLNNRIVLTADHKYLDELLAQSKKKDASNEEATSTTPGKSPKKVPTSSPKPSKPFTLNDDSLTENLVVDQEAAFESKLKLAAYFSIAMILFMLFVLTWRRLAINKKLLSPKTNNIPMQALNHLVLAPKQKLSLVQVGHEKLLLSVSPEGISLITHIPEKNKLTTSTAKTAFDESDRDKMQTIMMRNLNSQQHLRSDESSRQAIKNPRQMVHKINRSEKTEKPTFARKKQSSPPEENDLKKPKQTPNPKKIEYAIDDNGIRKTSKKKATTAQANTTQKAIDDVTQLIREKLKSLPKIQ